MSCAPQLLFKHHRRLSSYILRSLLQLWFGVNGLVMAGRNFNNCSAIRKACDFLLSEQLPSGGWGESYLSCQDKVYSNLEGNRSHVVSIGWALMALIHAGQVYLLDFGLYIDMQHSPRS